MRQWGQFQIFWRRNFCNTKTQNKQNPTDKTKTSEYWKTKATIFCTQKLHKTKKIVYIEVFLSKIFLKKIWNCPDCLSYYTTDVYSPPPLLTPLWRIYLYALIFNCENLFLFIITCENLFFCKNLFLFMRISSYLWSPLRIYICHCNITAKNF